jgi:alpha-mannosidase
MMEEYHESFNFTFDGQTSIVDDYLQFANEANKAKLFYYLKNNKIIIGP